MNLGIIAEDDSDVAVVKELTKQMVAPRRLGFKRFIGNGCGKIRRKSHAWAENLVRQGCRWVVLVHDLDEFEERALRRVLEATMQDLRATATIVLIPIREIESWLLYDSHALRQAFGGRRNPRLPGDPETLLDPKRTLGELVWRNFRREYVNTVHNESIARHIDTRRLCRARSFMTYPPFIDIIKRQLR